MSYEWFHRLHYHMELIPNFWGMTTHCISSTKIEGVESGNFNLLVRLEYVPHVHFVFKLGVVGPMMKTKFLIYHSFI